MKKTLSLAIAVIFVAGFSFNSAHAETIPDWVKNNAGWWADGTIDDSSFVQSIEFLMNEGIMQVSVDNITTQSSESIPKWVKNNAGWWADGTLQDSEFLNGMKFLVQNGIISVENKTLMISDGNIHLVAQASADQMNSVVPKQQAYEMHAGHKDGVGVPGVAIDAKRNAIHVTYGDITNGKTNIMIKTSYDAGKTWSEPVRVSEDGKGSMPHARPAEVKVAPNGDLYVLYGHSQKSQEIWDLGFNFGFTDLYLAKSTDGGKTFEHTLIADMNTSITHDSWVKGNLHSKSFESIFIDEESERVYVAWLDSRGKQNGSYLPTQVRMSYSDDKGETFKPSVVVKSKACQCCATDMCKTDETMFVQYRNIIGSYGEPNYRDIVVSNSDDLGDTWSPPTLIADDGFEVQNCPHAVSTITTDSEGNIHAAWYTMGGGLPGLYYAISTDDGKTWSEPLLVDSSLDDKDWFPATNIVIRIDSNDKPVLTWTNKTVQDNLVRHASIIDYTVSEITELGAGSNAWMDSKNGITAIVWETPEGEILVKSWNNLA